MDDFLLDSHINLTDAFENIDFTVERNKPITEEIWFRVVFIVSYCLIFIVGISGNIGVLVAIFRKKVMRNMTNILIANMAIFDILVCLFDIPFTQAVVFINSWIFGEAMCRFVPMIHSTTIYVTAFTCVAIAIYRTHISRNNYKATPLNAFHIVMVVVIWSISLGLSLPKVRSTKLVKVVNLESTNWYCVENYGSEVLPQVTAVMKVILCFILPTLGITTCYLIIALVVRPARRLGIGTSDYQMIKKNNRANIMFVIIFAVFVACWMPLFVIHILSVFHENRFDLNPKLDVLIFYIARLIAMSTTLYKPFVYLMMSSDFKKEFKSMLCPCLLSTKKRLVSEGHPGNEETDTITQQGAMVTYKNDDSRDTIRFQKQNEKATI